MATPHVVGAAALLLAQNPTWTPQQVRDAMVANATSDKITNPGTGTPNKVLFVGGGAPPANDFSLSVAPAASRTPARR